MRRLFEALGHAVSRLIRIRYGAMVLPRGLKRGVWMELDERDVQAIRRLTLGDGGRRDAGPARARPGPAGDRNEQRNERQQRRRNDRGGRGPNPNAGRGRVPMTAAVPGNAGAARDGGADRDGRGHGLRPGAIPNPLEQTFDKRFVQNPRSPPAGAASAAAAAASVPAAAHRRGARAGPGGPSSRTR